MDLQQDQVFHENCLREYKNVIEILELIDDFQNCYDDERIACVSSDYWSNEILTNMASQIYISVLCWRVLCAMMLKRDRL